MIAVLSCASYAQDAGRQAALLAAVSALCALSTLRMSARRQLSRADISAEEALMRAASEILAARRALTQQHGAWVKACLTQLGALLQALKEVPAGWYKLLYFYWPLTLPLQASKYLHSMAFSVTLATLV